MNILKVKLLLIWIEKKSFSQEEIAIRFSQRLVKIHLFPNGNGRHSTLVADIMISKLFNKPVFRNKQWLI